MSNGRKWRRGRVGVAAAASLGMAIAPLALIGGTAYAVPGTIGGTIAPFSGPEVATGTTSSGSPTFTLTLGSGTYANGDIIAIDITQQAPLAANEVSFAGTPTVLSVTGTPGQTTPAFSASLARNQLDPVAQTATDEIDLTETGPNSQTNSTGPFTITVSGATITAASNAPLGNYSASATYHAVVGVGSGPTALTGTVATVTNLIAKGGIPIPLPTTPQVVSLPNVTVTESQPGVIGNSITLTLGTVGAGATATFAAAPTVTSSNSAVVITPGASPSNSTTYTFTTNGPTNSSPQTLTISGIQVNASTPQTADKIILTENSSGGAGGAAQAFPGGPVALGAVVTTQPPIAGPDAQTTAADIYNASNLGSKKILVLATDANFPDALSGAYLAGFYNAGIALTDIDSLPPATQNIIATNMPATIYVLGGPLAVDQNVISQIDSLYQNETSPTIIRLAGADQFGTNQQVIDSVTYPGTLFSLPFGTINPYNDTTGASSTSGPASGRTAIVASGTSFPDALAASVLAYKDQIPVVLTTGDQLSPSASSVLQGLGITQVIMVGGPAAISDTVEGQIAGASGLNIPVLRVAGQDATDTALRLASLETSVPAFGITGNGINYVARGDFYTDALAASQYLANVAHSPLLLTETPTVVGPYLPVYLAIQGAFSHDTLQQFGGPVAITPATSSIMVQSIAAGTQP